jgi:hypothetical protein
MEVSACHPSYAGGCRKEGFSLRSDRNSRLYLNSNESKKGWWSGLSGADRERERERERMRERMRQW